MNSTTFLPEHLSTQDGAVPPSRPVFALVIVWSVDEPDRVGEAFLIPTDDFQTRYLLGRGDYRPEDGSERLLPFQQRPGRRTPTAPLMTPTISREQLRLQLDEHGALVVTNVGRCSLRHNGQPVDEARVVSGDLLELRGQLLLLCVQRTEYLVPPVELVQHPFGQADAFGLVGESAVLWELREQLTFVSGRSSHVLIQGASGTGKELAARAIHAGSPRCRRPLISRNAATFPESLIDAELFGNVRNYPNQGMPERPGLIGEADGSTLFLDEFGELPALLQTHLLRVLDQGEYQRLGEARPQRADLRLVAATNRPEEALKHDVLARLKLRIVMPDLNARREDIPLLTRHILRTILAEDPALAQRRFAGQLPRLSSSFVKALILHTYTTHYRELEQWLWKSIGEARGLLLDTPSGFETASKPGGGGSQGVAPAPVEDGRGGAALVPASSPSSGGLEQVLDLQERLLLSLFRRHRLNVTTCSADPACPVQRVTADVHLRVILFKSLAAAGWDLDLAASRLTGDEDQALQARFRRRLETSVETLRQRLRQEGGPTLRRKLSRAYGAGFRDVDRVLVALEEGRLPEPSPGYRPETE